MKYYEILKINDVNCDFKHIRKAYYRRVKQCHPDLFNNSRHKEEEFKRLVKAFDVLSDPVKRKEYDLSMGNISDEQGNFSYFPGTQESIMDTEADDTLEELLAGNNPPKNTSLATLFLDLERTEVFMKFREAKTLYSHQKYHKALSLLLQAVAMSPGNIIYRYFLARTYVMLGKFSHARIHYKTAINLGDKRIPPQKLEKIRSELDKVIEHSMPIWHRLLNFFGGDRVEIIKPPDQQMIEETNRAMTRLAAEMRRKKNKRLDS